MMLKLLLAALLTTATALPAEAVDLSPRIAGGTPAASGDFSFYVSIKLEIIIPAVARSWVRILFSLLLTVFRRDTPLACTKSALDHLYVFA